MRKLLRRLKRFFYINLIILKNRIYKRFFKKKNTDINILFLIGKIYGGGAERACINIAEGLSEKYNVTLLLCSKKCDDKEQYECKIPIIKLDKNKNLYETVKSISKIKKEKNITHTVSFLTESNYLNVLTSQNDKTIISIRNYLSESVLKKEEIKKHKIACKYADKIVTVSKAVEIDQINNFNVKKEKVQTIPNLVDENKIIGKIQSGMIDEKEKNIFENSNVVITMGRLVSQKAQWHLIRSFKNVVKEIPNAKLIILGDGELKEYLNELIIKLELSENVFLLGVKSNPYIYMKKSDVFVLTSLFEGMPNAILEAMQCGLPVIATDCMGGNKEILSLDNSFNYIEEVKFEEYGILIPPLDSEKYLVEELTESEKNISFAIIKLLKEKDLQNKYKNKSIERVNDFSTQKIIDRWEKLLN